MKFGYKVSLIVIIGLLATTIYIGINYKQVVYNFNKVFKDNAIVISLEELSINYLDGNEINYVDEEYVKEFSISNVSTDTKAYTVSLVNNTSLDESNSAFVKLYRNDELLYNKITLLDSINEILVGEELSLGNTNRYKLVISSGTLTKDSLSGKIHVTPLEEKSAVSPLVDAILANNEPTEFITIPGSAPALRDEGLIKGEDNHGDSYYFRGASKNNYLSFAGYDWRIIRITGDKQVKIILDEELPDLVAYYSNDIKVSDYKETSSYQLLLNWYNQHLSNYASSLSDMEIQFENTLGTENMDIAFYEAYNRIYMNNAPAFSIDGDISYSKIGLITADELVFAGAYEDVSNTTFYLYKSGLSNNIATNSLYYNDINDTDNIIVMNCKYGNLDYVAVNTSVSLRPVVTLNENIILEGLGTRENPYVIK